MLDFSFGANSCCIQPGESLSMLTAEKLILQLVFVDEVVSLSSVQRCQAKALLQLSTGCSLTQRSIYQITVLGVILHPASSCVSINAHVILHWWGHCRQMLPAP